MTKAAKERRKNKKHKIKRKVWRIADFQDIFELADDVRKERSGPLTYTKSLVTLSGYSKEAEVRHFERMRLLKAHNERHLLRSAFEDLKNWTGGKHYGQRGYLVTSDNKPASIKYIAAQLDGFEEQDLDKAIPILEEIGLIERVSMNGTFEPNPDKSGPGRNETESSGRKRTPLKKNKNKKKTKEKNKSPNGTKTKTKSGNGKPLRAKEKTKTIDRDQSVKMDGQGKKRTTAAPTTTPVPSCGRLVPQTSDAGESRIVQFPKAPPGSVKKQNNSIKLGEITKSILHRYNPDAQAFAVDIYAGLKLLWPNGSNEYNRSIGCFAASWQKAIMANLPPPVLAELRSSAIAEAKRIGKHLKKGNARAVWCKVYRRKLNKRINSEECRNKSGKKIS